MPVLVFVPKSGEPPINPPGDWKPTGQRFLLTIQGRTQNRIYEPPAVPEVFADSCETTDTWADLMRESKIPDDIGVGMAHRPHLTPSKRGSLY